MDVTPLTDGGANINDYSIGDRLSCNAHNLATVLRHLLAEKYVRVHAPSITTSLEVSRSMVT